MCNVQLQVMRGMPLPAHFFLDCINDTKTTRIHDLKAPLQLQAKFGVPWCCASQTHQHSQLRCTNRLILGYLPRNESSGEDILTTYISGHQYSPRHADRHQTCEHLSMFIEQEQSCVILCKGSAASVPSRRPFASLSALFWPWLQKSRM